MNRIMVLTAAGLLLAGCAGSPTPAPVAQTAAPRVSVVAGIDDAERDDLARILRDLVRAQADPRAGPLAVRRANDTTVTPRLMADLAADGFTLVDGDHVTYEVGPVAEAGLLVRVRVGAIDMARLFSRGEQGSLAPIGPLTVGYVP